MKTVFNLLAFVVVTFVFSQPGMANEQTNFNLGMDMPASGSTVPTTNYLIRFQLQKAPKFFTPRGGFSFLYGSKLMGGEFNLGIVAYPFHKLREDLRPQPFLGVDGGLYVGKRGESIVVSPGGIIVMGVDFRLFKTTGLTIEADYAIFPNQRSARILFGVYSFLI